MVFGRSRRETKNRDAYAERANASLSVYNAEPAIPATMYAAAPSHLRSNYGMPSVSAYWMGAFVNRRPVMDGIEQTWIYGATDTRQVAPSTPSTKGGLNGRVNSTDFQGTTVQLRGYGTNRLWYIAWSGTGSGIFKNGNPTRETYPSERVDQLDTRTSGGPGSVGMVMQPKPRFTRVQRIQKYNTTPKYYATTSNNLVRRQSGGVGSNVNRSGNQ